MLLFQVDRQYHNFDDVAYFQDLPPGTYVIQETQPPHGYHLNDEKQTVALQSAQVIRKEVRNYRKDGLTIKKVDPDGKPIAGAVFELRRGSGEVLLSETTDENGTIFRDYLSEGLYVIEEKTYEAHIVEEVHLYGLLHQLAFLAGKIKDREDVEAFIAAAKRYGQIADDKFDAWNIPGRYLVFGDKADLAGMKARELCELDAFYVECEDDEPEPGGGRQEEHYLIPGSGFRLLVSELHMFLVTWYSIAKCLSQAQNEKDFLRLQKKYGNYEKTLNRLRRKLGLSADSNFCQDELEAAVIKRFRAELIPGEQISHE